MPPQERTVEAHAEWFSMIIAYLKMKSLSFWLQCHPQSNYHEFECAWPAMLDQMMASATRASMEQLKILVQPSRN